jgi:hypothetical protein
VPFMLFGTAAIGWAIRKGAVAWDFRDSLVVALMSMAALGLKVTLGIYPLVVGLTMLGLRIGFIRSAARMVLSAVCGVMSWVVLLFIYYGGRLVNLRDFIKDEMRFGGSLKPTESYFTWFRAAVADADSLLRFTIVLPIIILVLYGTRRWRGGWGLALGLMIGAVAYNVVLFFRYQPVTWFEAAAFASFATIVFLRDSIEAGDSIAKKCLLGGLLLFSLSTDFRGFRYVWGDYRAYLQNLTNCQRQVSSALAPFHDNVAFLIPDNSYRPLTVDSAIWKGGSNILEANRFGASAIVRRIVPRRAYLTNAGDLYNSPTPNMHYFDAMVFTLRVGVDSGPEEQLGVMAKKYIFAPADWSLAESIDFGSQRLLIWTRALSKVAAAPRNVLKFSATRTSPAVIELNWSPLSDHSYFRIEMETGNSFGAKFVTIGKASRRSGHYRIGDVSPVSSYSFRITRLVNGAPAESSDTIDVPVAK